MVEASAKAMLLEAEAEREMVAAEMAGAMGRRVPVVEVAVVAVVAAMAAMAAAAAAVQEVEGAGQEVVAVVTGTVATVWAA